MNAKPFVFCKDDWSSTHFECTVSWKCYQITVINMLPVGAFIKCIRVYFNKEIDVIFILFVFPSFILVPTYAVNITDQFLSGIWIKGDLNENPLACEVSSLLSQQLSKFLKILQIHYFLKKLENFSVQLHMWKWNAKVPSYIMMETKSSFIHLCTY